MSTLEEEIVRPLKEQLALGTQNGRTRLALSNPPSRSRWWHHIFSGVVMFAVSVAACGVFQLKASWGNTWQTALHEFQWFVFVNGDSLAVDEVGRFLKRLDGVKDVIYESPDDAMQRFRGEKLSLPLDVLGTNPFPPAWRVTWVDTAIGSTRMQEEFQDTLALPGVADVAYDKTLIEKLRTYRFQWLQAKWVLTAMLLSGAILWAILGGFLLAHLPFSTGSRKNTVISFLSDIAFWAAGFGLVFISLGPLPWVLIAGGIAAAVLRWMFFQMLRIS